MSDERYAASDGGGTEVGSGTRGRTTVVTKPATRPQRPTGKRSRQRAANASNTGANVEVEESSTQAAIAKEGKVKKPKKSADRSANPIVFIYNYLKQVVGEMRKVIWPNRKQMLTYTSVVLAFLAFMVALVGLADFGLAKLVLLVFG
ncbi:preprotein translocase subunit SecE [Mycobacterium leprae Kyoto-2]|uniref:Protein translocase subunit SecE n=3 Tax=Mycobacterium leprae TaxID=1769 RepID=SECE_MYCLE|nr:preprotein translocase subunit SecE [Mycobacterium leprae]Q9CBJ9.1 RecName: Full=Protein translocase subunit SecE [Mycobacterium leprae TN]CAR72003.1 SecE preprotein translocase [Mycobacterium leprae Br4923]AWV48326.1 preprotein translocase subunit SecE [Mycobacterium leprae]OAR20865.1 preprotein translocase subunit SecE [Mycobacterium leprae 3125609]OAX70985.1 preprotein translocase subunit SecE [Mycobacterium leprae 7935681]CAC30861.1 SecE preprotein translocase [Mycobacterium leprae]